MDAETQTQETEETQGTAEPQKRSRRKGIRRRLDERLQQLDSLSRNPELKPTKQAEAAIEATAIEKMLFQAEREDRKDESLQENETLRAQHEKDTAEIERLRAIPTRHYEPVTIPDPESPRLRQTIDDLKSFIKYLASERETDPAHMAIRATLKFGKTAREYVTALGIDFNAYFSNLNSSSVMTEANLKASVDPPEDEDLHTMLNRPGVGAEFAVAALAVVHQVDIKAPVRRVNGANSPRDYTALAADEFND